MTDTEQLIKSLSVERGTARRATIPSRILWQWLLVSVASVVVMLAIFGLRDDLREKLADGFFVAEILTLSAITISMAFAAAIYSFPDLYQRKYSLLIQPIALSSFAISLVFASMGGSNAPAPAHDFICLFCITLFSMFPAVWMFVLLRKQATTHQKIAGCTALLAACSIGALTLRLSEKTDSIEHLILWHYLPMLGYALIGAWLGKKFLKW